MGPHSLQGTRSPSISKNERLVPLAPLPTPPWVKRGSCWGSSWVEGIPTGVILRNLATRDTHSHVPARHTDS